MIDPGDGTAEESPAGDDVDGGGPADGADTVDGDNAASERRHERLLRHPTRGPRNSLFHWPEAKSPLRVTLNYVLVWIVRIAPSLRLKNWVLRRLGATVGVGVAWGLEATPDVFWPELVTVDDDAIVGYDATLLCHEFLQTEYRTGPVCVGARAMIGAGAIVLPGVEIGADAQVAANSLVVEDVPPGATVAGVPAKPVTDGLEADDGRGGPNGEESGGDVGA